MRKITRENDVLLITDEVMTGWGRVGEWFAVNLWGVQPDILTTAKGASASYVPIGITAVSKEIADFFEDKMFTHGHTFEATLYRYRQYPQLLKNIKEWIYWLT